MKILFSSYFFSPSLGGIETVSALLAPEFVKAGHEVILVTTSEGEDGLQWPFPIYRRPDARTLVKLVRWCDVYFQNNISLEFAWPLLFWRRPWVVAHHTWIGHSIWRGDWKGPLKRILIKYATNATISRVVSDDLPVPSTIVGNPYSEHLFQSVHDVPRTLPLAFLGRLVSDKGIDLLIRALTDLRARGLRPTLTIIGTGPEEGLLKDLTHNLELDEVVHFVGAKVGSEIVRELSAHQILVVPSRWREPFGLVALEGIASGCVVVAAESGGLPDAVGPCGLTFPIDDRKALADALYTLLTVPRMSITLREGAARHLEQFKPATVAGRYLKLIEEARARF